jgi:hypothetical protein
MGDFPVLKTGAVIQYPAIRAIEYSTRVLRFLDGTEQRFRDYGAPVLRWVIRLDLLDEEEMAKLEDFFRSEQGRTGTFTFTDPWDSTEHPNCSLDNDWIQLRFGGPGRGSTGLVVRKNRD